MTADGTLIYLRRRNSGAIGPKADIRRCMVRPCVARGLRRADVRSCPFAAHRMNHRERVRQVLASAWPDKALRHKLLAAAIGHAVDLSLFGESFRAVSGGKLPFRQ